MLSLRPGPSGNSAGGSGDSVICTAFEEADRAAMAATKMLMSLICFFSYVGFLSLIKQILQGCFIYDFWLKF